MIIVNNCVQNKASYVLVGVNFNDDNNSLIERGSGNSSVIPMLVAMRPIRLSIADNKMLMVLVIIMLMIKEKIT